MGADPADPAAVLAGLRAVVREAHEAEQGIRQAIKDAEVTANGALKLLIRKTMLEVNAEISARGEKLRGELDEAIGKLLAKWEERDQKQVQAFEQVTRQIQITAEDVRRRAVIVDEDLPAAFRSKVPGPLAVKIVTRP